MREFDYFLNVKKSEDKAGLMNFNNYELDQQLIDLGNIFSGVEEEMYKSEKNKKGDKANYKKFSTWIHERPKKVLHLLADEVEKLSRPRREWLEPLVWDIIYKEYNDIEEIKKLKEGKWNCITHDTIRSL